MVTTQNIILLLLQGFLSISGEILAIRLFTPHFGAGPVQTSVVIGTVLIFSALGASRSPESSQEKLGLNFTFFLLSSALLCNPFMEILKSSQIVNFPIRIFIMSLLTLAPMSYFSGRAYPMLLQRLGEKELKSGIAIATLGAFLGAVLTAILLVYFLPASWMLVLNSSLIFILASFAGKNPRQITFNFLVLALICFLNLSLNKKYVTWESGMADYKMEEAPGFKGLIINGGKYSSMIMADGRTMPYNDALHSILLKDSSPLDILVLGAGGFTLSVPSTPHQFTYVDSDPKIEEIIRKKFNPDRRGKFIHSDAREFFIKNTKAFDVIFQDIYDGSPDIPRYLLTVEYFREIKKHLRAGGFAGFNLTHKGPITQKDGARIARTLQLAFGVCYFVPVHGKSLGIKDDSLRQTIALCQNESEDPKPITDDHY